MSQLLRVGLVGYGYAGRTFHAPLIHATPGLELAAVASQDAARVRADQGAEMPVLTPAALLAREDLHLVVIAAPNDQHFPLARAALQAGRHVVVDKPFTLDVLQARQLSDLAARQGRVLSVFHNRRWDSDFLTLAALVREGRLGRVVQATLHFDRFRPQVRDRWREGSGPGAGLWMDLGPHLLDQALQLFGWPQFLSLERVRQREGAVSDDGFSARLRWRHGPQAGLRVDLHASMLAATPGPRYVVHGTLGSVQIDGLDPQEDALKALLAQGASPQAQAEAIASRHWGQDPRRAICRLSPQPGAEPQIEALPLRPGRYTSFYAGVREAIVRETASPVTLEEALSVQTLLDLGVESDEAARECPVPR